MKVFDLQIPTDTVSIESGQSTSVTFTATNRSDGPLTGLVHLQPRGSCAEEWLSVQGAQTLDFEEDGSHQIEVEVRLPDDAEPGSYDFALIVASEENPDEDYVEGVVQFDVAGAQPVPQKPSRWPLFVAIGVGVLVLIALGILLGVLLSDGEPEPEPPDRGDREEVVRFAHERARDAKNSIGMLEEQARQRGREVSRMWASSLQPRLKQQFEMLARNAEALEELQETESEERWEEATRQFEETDQRMTRLIEAARTRLRERPTGEGSTRFAVVLRSVGRQKIQVIKTIREVTGLGLRESKELTDEVPSTISKSLSKERAHEIVTMLERAGAKADLVPHED